MSPRGAALVVAIVLIICGAIAAGLVGVPWPATVAGSVLAMAIAYRVVTKWRRGAPPMSQ
jgi:hypothetical protein